MSGGGPKAAIETAKEKGTGVGTGYNALKVVLNSPLEKGERGKVATGLILCFVNFLLECPTKPFTCLETPRSAPHRLQEEARKLDATLGTRIYGSRDSALDISSLSTQPVTGNGAGTKRMGTKEKRDIDGEAGLTREFITTLLS